MKTVTHSLAAANVTDILARPKSPGVSRTCRPSSMPALNSDRRGAGLRSDLVRHPHYPQLGDRHPDPALGLRPLLPERGGAARGDDDGHLQVHRPLPHHQVRRADHLHGVPEPGDVAAQPVVRLRAVAAMWARDRRFAVRRECRGHRSHDRRLRPIIRTIDDHVAANVRYHRPTDGGASEGPRCRARSRSQ